MSDVRYLPGALARRCEQCGRPLEGRQERWCSRACSARAHRARRKTRTVTDAEVAADRRVFGDLWQVHEEAELAVVQAIDALRDEGYTWREIAGMAGRLSGEGMRAWRQRRSAPDPQPQVVG